MSASTLASRTRTFAPLAVANFRWYLTASACVTGAFGMQNLAISWLMYELTNSPALVGLNLLAMAIPQITLSFVGGVVADRVSKRLIMMACFVSSAVMFSGVGLAQHLGVLSWPYLVAASFGVGAVSSFQMPARQGIITQLLGREQLTPGIALNQASQNAMQLGAPALAGFLIASVGISSVFFFMAGLNVIAIFLLLPVRYAFVRSTAKWSVGTIFGNLMEGLRYVRRNSKVRDILAFSLFTTTFAMPYTVLLPVLAKDVLHADAQRLGFLVSASGVGALIGSLLMASAGKTRRGLLFIHTAFVTGLALLLVSTSALYALTMVAMAVLGLAGSARMTLPNILLQTYSEDGYVGRVLSLYLLQFGLTSVGGFGVSVAAQFIGVQWALGISALALIAIAVAYYRFSGSMKALA